MVPILLLAGGLPARTFESLEGLHQSTHFLLLSTSLLHLPSTLFTHRFHHIFGGLLISTTLF